MTKDQELAKIALRDRKFAKVRLALKDALLGKLGQRNLDEISVRELCQEVEISEATFFNYFAQKSDLIVYFIRLWSIETALHLKKNLSGQSGIKVIEAIFDYTAGQVSLHPEIMLEIIAFQARVKVEPQLKEITLAEKLMAFEDIEDYTDLPSGGIETLIPPQIEAAKKNKELPKNVNVDQAFLGLAAIFFGVPLIMCKLDPGNLHLYYRIQLSLFWTGLRSR